MTAPPPSEPTVTIPLKEWQRMNQRIGYMEGVWLAIRSDVNCSDPVLEKIEKRYAEICGEAKP